MASTPDITPIVIEDNAVEIQPCDQQGSIDSTEDLKNKNWEGFYGDIKDDIGGIEEDDKFREDLKKKFMRWMIVVQPVQPVQPIVPSVPIITSARRKTLNGYNIFFRENIGKYKGGQIPPMKAVGAAWKDLTKAEQEPYKQKAKEENEKNSPDQGARPVNHRKPKISVLIKQ